MDIKAIRKPSGPDPARPTATGTGAAPAEDMFASMLDRFLEKTAPQTQDLEAPAPRTRQEPERPALRHERPAAHTETRRAEARAQPTPPRPRAAEKASPSPASPQAADSRPAEGRETAQPAKADAVRKNGRPDAAAQTADDDTTAQGRAAAAEPQSPDATEPPSGHAETVSANDDQAVPALGGVPGDLLDPAAQEDGDAGMAAGMPGPTGGQSQTPGQTAGMPQATGRTPAGAALTATDTGVPGTEAGTQAPESSQDALTETEFAALLQSARAAVRSQTRQSDDATQDNPQNGRNGGQNAQAGHQADSASDPGQTRNAQPVSQTVTAAQGPAADGRILGNAGPGNALEGAHTASRGAEPAPHGLQATDGHRAAGNQDFASHLQGMRSMRGGAAQHVPVTEQVSLQLQRGIKAGMDRMTLKLNPEELGRIEVRLEFANNGQVSARITAENAQTLELLQKDSRSLERALQDAGLKADSGSLSFNLRGDGREQQADRDGAGGRSGTGRPGHDPQTDNPERPPVRTVWLAPGRVDVRI